MSVPIISVLLSRLGKWLCLLPEPDLNSGNLFNYVSKTYHEKLGKVQKEGGIISCKRSTIQDPKTFRPI